MIWSKARGTCLRPSNLTSGVTARATSRTHTKAPARKLFTASFLIVTCRQRRFPDEGISYLQDTLNISSHHRRINNLQSSPTAPQSNRNDWIRAVCITINTPQIMSKMLRKKKSQKAECVKYDSNYKKFSNLWNIYLLFFTDRNSR